MIDLKYKISLSFFVVLLLLFFLLFFFFFATRNEKLAIDLCMGARSAKAICVFRRSYFPCIDGLMRKNTYLLISFRYENWWGGFNCITRLFLVFIY